MAYPTSGKWIQTMQASAKTYCQVEMIHQGYHVWGRPNSFLYQSIISYRMFWHLPVETDGHTLSECRGRRTDRREGGFCRSKPGFISRLIDLKDEKKTWFLHQATASWADSRSSAAPRCYLWPSSYPQARRCVSNTARGMQWITAAAGEVKKDSRGWGKPRIWSSRTPSAQIHKNIKF